MERLEKGLGRLWRRVRGNKKKKGRKGQPLEGQGGGGTSNDDPSAQPSNSKRELKPPIEKHEKTVLKDLQEEDEDSLKQPLQQLPAKRPKTPPLVSSDEDDLPLGDYAKKTVTVKQTPSFKKRQQLQQQRAAAAGRGPLLAAVKQKESPPASPKSEEAKDDLYQKYWTDMLKRFQRTLDECSSDHYHSRLTAPGLHKLSDSEDAGRLPRRSRDFDKESYAESLGHESGYLSGLDLTSRESHSGSESHGPYTGRFSPASLDGLLSIKKKTRSKPSESTDELLSEAESKTSVQRPHEEKLKQSVCTTKYITAVFEAENSGMDEVLEDVLAEFDRWFGPKTRLFGVACEVQWSVPEKFRDRLSEIRLKEGMHLAMRNNNQRLLDLFTKTGGKLPIRLAEATIDENCQRDNKMNTFQGVYRRSYTSMWPWQHTETGEWHGDYWRPAHRQQAQARAQPAAFLFGTKPESLKNRTLVAVNFVGLELAFKNQKPTTWADDRL